MTIKQYIKALKDHNQIKKYDVQKLHEALVALDENQDKNGN